MFDTLNGSKNCAINIIRTSVNMMSWEYLAGSIASGDGARLISVGDKIPIILKNGEQANLIAVHANPYWENSMAFAFEDCLNEHVMNDSGRYQDGYESCDMRKYITNDILPLLPDDLLSVIQPRTIRQKSYNGSTHQFSEKLWLMSHTELFGQSDVYKDIDIGDIQFDHFKFQKNRVKCVNGCPSWYWLRTPYAGDGGHVRGVGAVGSVSFINAFISVGVAPACIIGAGEPNVQK